MPSSIAFDSHSSLVKLSFFITCSDSKGNTGQLHLLRHIKNILSTNSLKFRCIVKQTVRMDSMSISFMEAKTFIFPHTIDFYNLHSFCQLPILTNNSGVIKCRFSLKASPLAPHFLRFRMRFLFILCNILFDFFFPPALYLLFNVEMAIVKMMRYYKSIYYRKFNENYMYLFFLGFVHSFVWSLPSSLL